MENEILKSIADITAGLDFAVGNDLVFVPEFSASFNDLFKDKVYTANEIAYCDQFADPLLRYASTWAAKEAVYKSIRQLTNDTLGWKSIEIIRKRTAGQPVVTLHTHPGRFKISLTISHDGEYAWAIAFIDTRA